MCFPSPGVILLLTSNLNLMANRIELPSLPFSPADQIANEKPFEDWNQRHREDEENTGERRITVPLTCHLSLSPSHQSPFTSHSRASGPKGQSMQNPGVLWFMIKKGQMAIKFRITIEESLGVIQKLLVTGDLL
jgi:hypothetical protein